MAIAKARSDLPARDGVGASRVFMPAGRWNCVIDFLHDRFPYVGRLQWEERLAQGLVLGGDGLALQSASPALAGGWIYYYRDTPQEKPLPFAHQVLYRDAHIVVVDKPHYLPVVPSGPYLQQTLLLRLRHTLGLQDLVPLHRLDRDTAGLVLFSVQPETRNAYYALFRQRRVEKVYEAIARYDPDLPMPQRRESHIGSSAHFMQQAEVAGPFNAITDISLLEVHGPWARYRLQPQTGKRHQLRVHMMALGLPILHDGIYPQLTPEGASDFSKPLQLLAKNLGFVDPISGRAMAFESQQRLLPLDQI